MNTQLYSTDLADSQWSIIQAMAPLAKPGGRPRTLEMRQDINAILYVTTGGIPRRMLPREYPNWPSVYSYSRTWRKAHVWRRFHDTLRAMLRPRAGRHKHPTAGSADSQCVKQTEIPGCRGYDKGRQVNGRRRHLLVVTVASVQDRDGAKVLLIRIGGARNKLRIVWMEGDCRGRLIDRSWSGH